MWSLFLEFANPIRFSFLFRLRARVSNKTFAEPTSCHSQSACLCWIWFRFSLLSCCPWGPVSLLLKCSIGLPDKLGGRFWRVKKKKNITTLKLNDLFLTAARKRNTVTAG
jgi:hypothetical protein